MHAVEPLKDPLAEPAPWNEIAAGYDQFWFERLPALTDRAIELLRPERGDRVLDVASGPGIAAVRLAPRVGHVMAVDFAEAMIERLRGHIMRSRLPNLEGRLMNVEELDFDDASFDAALCLFGVSVFDNRARALEELLRVIVPGGRIVLGSWSGPEPETLVGAAMTALGEVLPESRRFARSPEAPEVLERQLDVAGFEQVASHEFTGSLRFASVEEYWQRFEASSPELVLLRRELGAERYAEAAARARAVLESGLGVGAFELRCGAILTYGERPLSAA